MNTSRKSKNSLIIYLIIAVGIVALYFFTRLYNIMHLPIFTDEAIYVRWAQIAKQDANWRFISLVDGKQPSFTWITMVLLKFIHEPLLAGRIVSVIAGFFSMIGLFFLGNEVFKNTKIGIISSLVYVLYPMALVYDRMALYDSLVGTFAVWGLLFIILLVRSIRLDISLILGMVLGGGVLTKSNAFLNIYLLPFSLLLFDWKTKNSKKNLLKFIGLSLISTIIAYAMYSILRLSPFFHVIDEKNELFVYPYKEWIQHPFEFLWSNLQGVWDWLRRYLTLSGILLVPLAFVINQKFWREKLMLFLWFLIPFIALATFGKTLYPRFIFSMTLNLLPLITYSLYYAYFKIKNKLLFSGCLLLLAILPLWSDLFIITNFAHARIPFADVQQYNNDWTSGGGVNETVEFFKQQAQDKKIYIGTQGTFGLMPYALEIYLVQNPNIKIVGFWPIEQIPPKELLEAAKKMPTYVLFYQPCVNCAGVGLAPKTWPVTLVKQYQRGLGDSRPLSIYQVNP